MLRSRTQPCGWLPAAAQAPPAKKMQKVGFGCGAAAGPFLTHAAAAEGAGAMGGILSDDPAVAGNVAGWNAIWVHYCDGTSFTSDRLEPANNGTLFYRGRYILDAPFADAGAAAGPFFSIFGHTTPRHSHRALLVLQIRGYI